MSTARLRYSLGSSDVTEEVGLPGFAPGGDAVKRPGKFDAQWLALLGFSRAVCHIQIQSDEESGLTTSRIEMNPKVMMGKPVIRSTRISVELILRKLGEGATEAALSMPAPA